MVEMPGTAKSSRQPGWTPASAKYGRPASTLAAMRFPYPLLKSASSLVNHSVVVAGTRAYRMSVKPSSRRNGFASDAGGSHADGFTNRTVVTSGVAAVAHDYTGHCFGSVDRSFLYSGSSFERAWIRSSCFLRSASSMSNALETMPMVSSKPRLQLRRQPFIRSRT
jgi:hypothetical protein